MPKTVTMKASELIEDHSIYPRNCVFDGHTHEIAEAIRAGTILPAVFADAKTKRLTDGFHRRRAEILVNGPDAQMEVQLVSYTSDADMVRDAISRNASHGRRLTTADIARCATLATKFRISRDDLAGMLHITRAKLRDITGRRLATGTNGETVVVRRAQEHLGGRTLTKAQEEIVTHVGGQTAMHHAGVLLKLIESDSLPDEPKLVERLRQLHEALTKLLVV